MTWNVNPIDLVIGFSCTLVKIGLRRSLAFNIKDDFTKFSLYVSAFHSCNSIYVGEFNLLLLG